MVHAVILYMNRFIEAQANNYTTALAEIRNGRKQTHWIWYVFPQIRGLGQSATSKYYAIRDLHEAEEYLQHPILGKRLIEISRALLELKEDNAHKIFGSPDDLKVRSSMTLFALVKDADPVFQGVLDRFFRGERDKNTLALV